MAQRLFWAVMEHLQRSHPKFGQGASRRYGFRFKRLIHLVDSTTISLVANCMDWAKHRRRKAAAKCHLRLDWQSLLPRFVVVEAADEHDSKRTLELCAGVKDGEIVVFAHLYELLGRGIFWVSRAKDNLCYRVIESRPVKGNVLRDEIIELTIAKSFADYPQALRRVVALVEVDGKQREMIFLTNQMNWSASSVADLYRCRWQIEVFFKQIKQTLQLADFLGHNQNAVTWQIWIALLLYVLLRFIAFLHRWSGTFSRLFTLLRATLWHPKSISRLLSFYGTANPKKQRLRANPEAAFLHFMTN